MLDLVIRGGQVVTPQGVGAWDVGVEGERIVAVAAPGTLPQEAGRVVDAMGKLVIPGGIDRTCTPTGRFRRWAEGS